jgi:glycosyltransferase involved in cell wall biosynthesis
MGVGRLTAQKDFSTLIRAFASLRTQRAARLMILGEGEERFQLEALVQELGLQADVALPGFIANPYKYLKWSTVFVLSSRWEGLGNVLIEAMAMGTSVVSTDCPNGPAEILESGRWGRLVPVGDVDALTKAMIATLDDPAPPDVARRAMDFEVDAAVDAYARALRIS